MLGMLNKSEDRGGSLGLGKLGDGGGGGGEGGKKLLPLQPYPLLKNSFLFVKLLQPQSNLQVSDVKCFI